MIILEFIMGLKTIISGLSSTKINNCKQICEGNTLCNSLCDFTFGAYFNSSIKKFKNCNDYCFDLLCSLKCKYYYMEIKSTQESIDGIFKCDIDYFSNLSRCPFGRIGGSYCKNDSIRAKSKCLMSRVH